MVIVGFVRLYNGLYPNVQFPDEPEWMDRSDAESHSSTATTFEIGSGNYETTIAAA